MATQTTKIGIVNRALQLVGFPQINSINENSRGARSMARAYDSVLLNELRKHFWNFAIKRISLVANATPPIFGKGNYFDLPGDFLMLAPMDEAFGIAAGGPISGPPSINDWQIEGNQIASNELGPLNVRYISSNLVESLFDVTFAEALSCALAINTVEELTNSNTKMANLQKTYDDYIKMARRRNAFENRPVQSPTDSWITSRF